MKAFFSIIFVLVFSSTKAQPPLDCHVCPTIDSVETFYHIVYSLEKGLEIRTITWEYFHGQVSNCDFGIGPDVLGGIVRDRIIQYPGGARYYLNGGFVESR